MDHLAALKEIYFEDWTKIIVRLGNAICDDDPSAINDLIQKYFSTAEAKLLFDGEIAYQEKNETAYTAIPVFLAVITSSRRALEAILDFTKNPNARGFPDDPTGSSTLLMEAAALGDLETVTLLLDRGANPNAVAVTDSGAQVTALGKAAIGGFGKTVSLLVDRGAVITIDAAMAALESENGLSPIFVSFVKSKPALIHEPCLGFGEMVLLHNAVGSGNFPTVKWLISMGADVNSIDIDGSTPLDFAQRFGHDVIAEYLLTNGGVTNLKVENKNELHNSIGTATQAEVAEKLEVTDLIERLELLEEKIGVSISGLYASMEPRIWATPPDFLVRMNFDIVSGGSMPLEDSFYLRASAYNNAGQIVGKGETYIYHKEFLGFDSRSIEMVVDQVPMKIRLFPAK